MTTCEFVTLPDAQRVAMVRLQERSGIAWGDFLASAFLTGWSDAYVGVPNFHGMFIGIEKDGYTHS